MNLAVIVGISNYGGSNDLPACKIDAEAINNVIKLTSKFDKMLTISDTTTANEVKDRLVKFVEEHKGQAIEEVFFYFTGHGEFYDNEFYYLMSDYNNLKRKTTTLQNTELDNLLRSLNPKLAIKFVDACNAGVTYVKEDNALEKYIKQSQNTFNNCYFMFSSQQKQFSYQDDKLSAFTKSLLMSIKEHSMQSIRYKNIIDYISDDFDGNSQQTPLFITQADFTEVFTDISKEMRAFLTQKLDDTTPFQPGEKANSISSLEDLIKNEAAIYCSKDEAIDIINNIPELINNFSHDTILDKLYTIEVNIDLSIEKLPKISSVGQWLKDNKNNFFAKPTYIVESYEDYEDNYAALGLASLTSLASLGRLSADKDRKKITKQRRVINGFELTEELPFNHLEISAISKYPNIDSFALHIIFVLSKTDIRFFSFSSNFIETGWDMKKLSTDVKWKTVSAKLKHKTDLEDIISDIIDGFKKVITDYIQEKFTASQASTQEGDSA